MIARLLIVVLAVLNLGVAAWWLLRAEPEPAPPPAPAPGIAVLELVHTHARGSRPDGTSAPVPTPVPGAAGVTATQPAPAALLCLRSGLFADRAAATALQAELAPLLRASELDEEPGAAEIYQVLLPPAADRQAAEETVRKVQAAGFSDVLALRQGADANAVALGSYRNRDTAQRRVDALRQAGFPARLRGSDQGQPSRWRLLLATAHPEQVRSRVAGASVIDCARLEGLGVGN